jgi:predicted amidohydrolase YtcJ
MPAAELAIVSAAIRTLDPALPHASAVVVRDGRVPGLSRRRRACARGVPYRALPTCRG